MESRVILCISMVTLIVGMFSSPTVVLAQEVTYTTTAVPTKGSARASLNLTFRINEWTTDQEVLELAEILREGGPDKLRDFLEGIEKGRLSPQGRIGGDIAVARRRKTETGHHIILVTARLMPFLELYYGSRSRDYPFGWYEFDVDEEGSGDGAAIIAAKLQFNDENQLEITSYGIQPFQLWNVKRWD